MKFLLSWLREFLPTKLSAETIAETLTLLGLEVDHFGPAPLFFKGVVVAKVVEVQPHPDAEKLKIAKVFDGKEEIQVVCAAKNCRPGLLTAFAPAGAELRDEKGEPFFIKKTKLRGVESFGMLCAFDELGLPHPDKENGIIEFAEEFSLGTPLESLFSDTLFDVSLTPNLAHCASIVGIARELSAATQEPFHVPSPIVPTQVPSDHCLNITIQNPSDCRAYCAGLLSNVSISASPSWMQYRLQCCGIRSVNLIVDITNYVMLERGQPLHAFDFATLQGETIEVRRALPGEKITTLDGIERFPTEETLLICDTLSPAAIAGIMGGFRTEISEKTSSIIIESAFFNPTIIRKGSKQLTIQSEASRRFERGIDPNGLEKALHRAIELLCKLCPSIQCNGIYAHGEKHFPALKLSCRLERVNRILGTQLSLGEVENLFKRQGLKVHLSKNSVIELEIPSFRRDLHHEIDLIEEVARLYGYDHLHRTKIELATYKGSIHSHHPLFLYEREIRSHLVEEGLQEFLTCNLISPFQAGLVAKDVIASRSLISILNPSSQDHSVLRPSLLPNLLDVVKFNLDREVHSLSGYEVGKVHFKLKEKILEPTVASIILTGKKAPLFWEEKPKEFDFFDLKGMVENLFASLRIEAVQFHPSSYENFHPGRQARLLVDLHEIGILGEVHPSTLKKLEIHQPVYFAEINVEDLLKAEKRPEKYQPLPHTPSSIRDWTFTLKSFFPMIEVFRLIYDQKSSLLEEVFLIDSFQNERIGKEWKNVTIRFVYRDKSQTLSSQDAEKEHLRITTNVLKKLQEEKNAQ